MESSSRKKGMKNQASTKEPQIYINGEFFAKSEAKISVFDHGLLYGDGVFEGIRSYNCLVFKLKEHLSRLYEAPPTIFFLHPPPPQGKTPHKHVRVFKTKKPPPPTYRDTTSHLAPNPTDSGENDRANHRNVKAKWYEL